MQTNFLRKIYSLVPHSFRTTARRLLPLTAKRHLSRLFANRVPEGTTISVDDGRVFRVTRDRVFWRVYYERTYEPDLTAVIRRLVRETDHCVDVGANFGWYATLLAHLAPGGRVTAYEPVPEVFARLQDNIQLNGFVNRVELKNSCVGEKDGTVTFACRAQESGLAHIVGADSEEETIQVPMTTLDNDLSDAAGRIALIKIDAEGAEAKVLAGASSLLEAVNPPNLVVEVNSKALVRAGTSAEDVLRFLADRNYEFWRLDPQGQLLPFSNRDGDNAICAGPGKYGDRVRALTRD